MSSLERFLERALLCAACWAGLSCGESVLVARIGGEQRAQSDSLPGPARGSKDASPEGGAALDAGGASAREGERPDAAADSGSKNDGKHGDDDDDHDKDHD
jgi:hypothetical protein